MNVSFENGATVNRCWPSGPTTVLAAFAHPLHAKMFAEMLADRDAESGNDANVFYVVCDHYSGEAVIVKPKGAPAEARSA